MKQSLFLLLLTITVGTVSAKADNITFADANVKALCVANWDTDNDGELSMEEAAAVTTLGTVFKGKTNITTFDELRYFTGVTTIGEYAFSGTILVNTSVSPAHCFVATVVPSVVFVTVTSRPVRSAPAVFEPLT